ncbi:MAG: 30S ribosomal protein S17 [Patescibacteria group bacterium]
MTDKKDKQDKDTKKKTKRTFSGIVVSDKMDKTIVVKVDRTKLHKRYLKRYTFSRKYKVHDEKNQFKIGDSVRFIECRPISKDKMWKVIY